MGLLEIALGGNVACGGTPGGAEDLGNTPGGGGPGRETGDAPVNGDEYGAEDGEGCCPNGGGGLAPPELPTEDGM